MSIDKKNKIVKDEDKQRRKELEIEFSKCQKRGQMHKTTIMNWINKHQNKFNPQAKEMYRYFPEERRKHIELTLLFEKFDNDGSKALDFIEVYRMFRKYGIFISKQELIDFFKVVDQNKDFSLNLEEFKACYLDKAAKEIFAQIMKQLIDRTNLTEQQIQESLDEMNELNQKNMNCQHPIPALPKSFQGVISLLTYLNTRDEIKECLISKESSISQQIKSLEQLIELSNKIDIVQKVQIERKMKKQLSPQDRFNKFKNQIKNIKKQAIYNGQIQAEDELRQKNSASLIRILPLKQYNYNYHSITKSNTQKFKRIVLPQTTRDYKTSQKVTQFYEYMNLNVPEQLQGINNRIWTKLFENDQQLDIILQKNKKNQIESQRTDRLKLKVKQTLDNFQANFETDLETDSKKITSPQQSEMQITNPHFFNTKHFMSQTSDDFKTSRRQGTSSRLYQ